MYLLCFLSKPFSEGKYAYKNTQFRSVRLEDFPQTERTHATSTHLEKDIDWSLIPQPRTCSVLVNTISYPQAKPEPQLLPPPTSFACGFGFVLFCFCFCLFCFAPSVNGIILHVLFRVWIMNGAGGNMVVHFR